MRKMFIIGCGLIFAQLSAMSLPYNVNVVHHEKTVFNDSELSFYDSSMFINDRLDLEFVFENQSTEQSQKIDFGNVFSVNSFTGFYRKIDIQNHFNPYDQYDIDKSRDSFKDEFQSFSFLKKENIPRSSLF